MVSDTSSLRIQIWSDIPHLFWIYGIGQRKILKIGFGYIHITFILKSKTNTDIHISVFSGYKYGYFGYSAILILRPCLDHLLKILHPVTSKRILLFRSIKQNLFINFFLQMGAKSRDESIESN